MSKEKKRRGHPRMPINDGHDYSNVCSDMIIEYTETFTKENGLIRDITDHDREELDTDLVSFIYTDRGMDLIDRYHKRMVNLGEKHFCESEIDIYTGVIEI